MTTPSCRFCGSPFSLTLVDLGEQPLANSYLTEEELTEPEPRYPLHARVCEKCWLVQVEDVVPATHIFSDYAYFSSFSSSWVEHARRFAGWAVATYDLGSGSLVVEVASNDGYLLRHLNAAGVPVLGIEPAANVAAVAKALGIETVTEFFGADLAATIAADRGQADLVIANNVLAHVPDLNDFVDGIRRILKPEGRVSIEVPHLLRLLERVSFDTIYHEHFSYFSLRTARSVLAARGLAVHDVEELPTHGGSIRIHASHVGVATPTPSVDRVLRSEHRAGLDSPAAYQDFARAVECRVEGFRSYLNSQPPGTVAAYGAAAKATTFLNVTGVTSEDIPFVADRSTAKQGRFLPGSHVPIVAPDRLLTDEPAAVVLLAWNLLPEVREALPALVRRPTDLVVCTDRLTHEAIEPRLVS